MVDFKVKRGYEYEEAKEAKKIAENILSSGMYDYVELSKIAFLKSKKKKRVLKNGKDSKNSKPRNYIAKIHTISKIWFSVFPENTPVFVIEVASENFDHLSQDQKEQTMLHELYHIVPSGESGMLRCHNEFSCIGDLVLQYKKLKTEKGIVDIPEEKKVEDTEVDPDDGEIEDEEPDVDEKP